MITTQQVKDLRDKTGISVMQCKKVLEEAGGDISKALVLLKKKGTEVASKKSQRNLTSGVIASYIHAGSRIGVMVELLCETDFVAKNDEFKTLADDIAMHIAAMDPQFLKEEDITDDVLQKVTEVFTDETHKLDKSDDVKKKITEGKIVAYFKDKVLMTQSFVKEPELTIEGLIERVTQKTGERILISRFIRYSLLALEE